MNNEILFEAWLKQYKQPRDQCSERNLCAFSAFKGQIDTVKFFIMNEVDYDEETATQAALGGHLNIIEWLTEHLKIKWNEQTCTAAAYNGHLEILKYIRSHGCPWNADVCFFAAQQRHLDLLQWARENGCPWDKSSCEEEAKDFPEILDWLKTKPAFYEDEVREELIRVIKVMGEDPAKFLK